LNLSELKLFLVCLPKMNVVLNLLSIYGRKLAFLRKSVKSMKLRRENGVNTLKLHHDTLFKTLKKHWENILQ